jgi:rod shape-determining protein MreC
VLTFLRRHRVLLTAAVGLLIAAGLAVSANRAPMRTDRVGRLFLDVMAPLQRATAAVERTFESTWWRWATLVRARDENATLRRRARRLQQRLDRLAEVELENVRLRRLLDFRRRLRGELIAATVIGRDAGGLARTVLIDRGTAEGVARDAAVLVPEGIVGRVFRVGRHSARVLLISDDHSGVAALVQRSRAGGIVQGTVEGGCQLAYVKRTEDVQVNDEVVTSGLDGIFPKGLPIGRVAAVDRGGEGLFLSAEILPRVEFGQLEEVLVTRGPVASLEAEEEPAEGTAVPPADPPSPPGG